jgi:hypothetical protein
MYPYFRRKDGPQNGEKVIPLSGIEPRFLGLPFPGLVAISTELSPLVFLVKLKIYYRVFAATQNLDIFCPFHSMLYYFKLNGVNNVKRKI